MRSNTPDAEDPERGRQHREVRDQVGRQAGSEVDARSDDEAAQAAPRRSDAPRAPGLVVETPLDAGPRGARWLVHLDPDAGSRPRTGPIWTARGRPPRRLVLRLAAGTTGAGATAGPAASASPRLGDELRALDAAVAGPDPVSADGAEAGEVGESGAAPAAGEAAEEPPPVVARHLIRTWGHVETSHGTGLLVDAVEAVPLSRLLADRGTLAVGEVSTVLTPVAELLGHLHRRGVAHGDVTPATILVAADGRPMVAELGDAQLLGHLPSCAGAIETLAPERREIVAAADPSARAEAMTAGQSPAGDVHAVGAAAWTALTGEPPDDAARGPLTAAAPQTPGAVARLVESAMAEDPEDRPSAEEFAAELYRAAAPQPVAIDERLVPSFPAADAGGGRGGRPTSRGGAEDSAGRRPRRGPRRRMIGAAIAVAAAVIVGGALWWSASMQEEAAPAEDHIAAPSVSPSGPPEDDESGEASPQPQDGQDVRDRARRQLRDEDVPAALEGVAALRTSALRGAATSDDPRGLVEEYAWPDSPAATDERRMLATMVDQGLRYRGEAVSIDPLGDVEELAAEDGEQARRAVDAEVRAEAFVPADGGEEAGEAEPLSQRVRIVLVRREDVWKLHEVREPPDAERSANTSGSETA